MHHSREQDEEDTNNATQDLLFLPSMEVDTTADFLQAEGGDLNATELLLPAEEADTTAYFLQRTEEDLNETELLLDVDTTAYFLPIEEGVITTDLLEGSNATVEGDLNGMIEGDVSETQNFLFPVEGRLLNGTSTSLQLQDEGDSRATEDFLLQQENDSYASLGFLEQEAADSGIANYLAQMNLTDELRNEMEACASTGNMKDLLSAKLERATPKSELYRSLQLIGIESMIAQMLQAVVPDTADEPERYQLLKSATSGILGLEFLEGDNLRHHAVGKEVAELVKNKKPKQSRQFLSLLCRHMTRNEASKSVGRGISKNEWAAARQHCLYPGIGEPLQAAFLMAHRQRVKDKTLIDFIEWLKAAGYLQNMSFGQKVVRYFNNRFVAIESVKRTDTVLRIVQDYYAQFLEAADVNMDILDDSTDEDSNESESESEIPGLDEYPYNDDSDTEEEDEDDEDDEEDDNVKSHNNAELNEGMLRN
jgi:hypothetical protein